MVKILNFDRQIDEYCIEIESLQDANRVLWGTIQELTQTSAAFRQARADKRELRVEQGKLIEVPGVKLQELEKRFKLNSGKSHKPPSSDFGKKRKELKYAKS